MDLGSISLFNFEQSVQIERKIKEFLIYEKTKRTIKNLGYFSRIIKDILKSINLEGMTKKHEFKRKFGKKTLKNKKISIN